MIDARVRDRVRGVLVGCAAGDALGAPYEFGPPLPPGTEVAMTGGGPAGRGPGEWTDDTSMAVAIAVEAASAPLTETATLDRIVTRWIGWAATAPDVGRQTGTVLRAARAPGHPTTGAAARARAAARALHERTGRTAGNGALMRTAPVALAHLDDETALVRSARRVGELTHWDPESGDACVLWSLAIRRAVLTGTLDVHSGLDALPAARRARWAARLRQAVRSSPADFAHTAWVVEAVQAAVSALATHAGPASGTGTVLPDVLVTAVRGGRDADTVAAIAGSLAGAVHGESAVPGTWREALHGWPGLRAANLGDLAERVATGPG